MIEIQAGSVDRLADIVSHSAAERLVVFCGGSSYERSGAAAAIEEAAAGVSFRLIRDIPANPDLDSVNEAIASYRAVKPDLAVAIGGGSVMDLAKVVNATAPLSSDARPFVLGQSGYDDVSTPLVAIPTTSGTGSEATRYAVVTVDGTKTPMGDPRLIPAHVILDPELTYTTPRSVTASAGLDALSQCMESMWSVRSDEASFAVAVNGLSLAVANLEAATNRPDPRSRAAMMEAAHLSGIAIDTTATTAPHALSFRLTTEHGVPHGHAVALTLGAVLEYNAGVTTEDVNDARGVGHVRSVIDHICGILGVPDPAAGRAWILELIEAIGLVPTFAGVGAGSPDSRLAVAESVSALRLVNNPRSFTGNALRDMVAAIA